jgi:hypothetical protein
MLKICISVLALIIAPICAYGSDLRQAQQLISRRESHGSYYAIGNMVNGDRAYGKYQVMGFNIRPWTKKHCGRAMSPFEFLRAPWAQDMVFNGEFGRLMRMHGLRGAAAAWFAGEGGMRNRRARDVNGMTIARYISGL